MQLEGPGRAAYRDTHALPALPASLALPALLALRSLPALPALPTRSQTNPQLICLHILSVYISGFCMPTHSKARVLGLPGGHQKLTGLAARYPLNCAGLDRTSLQAAILPDWVAGLALLAVEGYILDVFSWCEGV